VTVCVRACVPCQETTVLRRLIHSVLTGFSRGGELMKIQPQPIWLKFGLNVYHGEPYLQLL
jgi:hypothetical protein